MSEVREEKIWFSCMGLKCSGLLYKPSELKSKTPAIIMANGFGAVKEMYLPEIARIWAKEGFVVLVFDYRYFGESEGFPRGRLYPNEQLSDYRCAISFVKTLPYVDENRICIWGTSFSGGHVLTLLAFPSPGLRCGIAQVPNVTTHKVALTYFGSLEPLMELAESGRNDSCSGKYTTIPIVSKGGFAVLVREEAYKFYMEYAMKFSTFRNFITLDSLERILQYYPGSYAEIIKKPIMFLIAEKDTTTPPEFLQNVIERVSADKEVMRVSAEHFEIYFPPLLTDIAVKELEWLREILES